MLITPPNDITTILLAAGESSRLGTPKQLLKYKGKSLMQHTIDLTKIFGLDTVIVLGASTDQIMENIEVYDAKIVQNLNWYEGLASSIRCGLNHALSLNGDTEAVIFVLCDQPFLSVDILKNIMEVYQKSGQPIIHCRYDEAFGPPTLFHKSLFPELMLLQGAQGAKKVVEKFPKKVAFVDFPNGKWDIDTLQDYQSLLQIKHNQ